MPLTADLYERNEYGDLDDSSTLLEGRELRGYEALSDAVSDYLEVFQDMSQSADRAWEQTM